MNIKPLAFTHISGQNYTVLTQTAAGAAAFVAAAGRTGGCPSLLCAGLAAAFPSAQLAVLAGSGLYYLLFAHFTDGLIPLCSILVISVISAAFSNSSWRLNPAFTAALCAGSLLIFTFAVSAATAADEGRVLVNGVSSLMTGCFVFAVRTLDNERSLTRLLSLGGRNTLYASMIYITVISVLSSLELFINPGRALGCTVLLAVAKRGRMSGGAAVGALTAAAVMIGAPHLAVNTMLLATAGLICGAFTELGVLAETVSFLAVCAAGLATAGGSDSAPMFVDAAVGAVLYAAVPQGTVRRLTSAFFGGAETADTVGRTTASRLSFAASSLGEIRHQLALVSAAMDKKLRQTPLAETVFGNMCRSCEHCCVCHREPKSSAAGFRRLEQYTLRYNGLTDADVRRAFPGCFFPELISDSFNYAYKAYLDGKAAQLRVGEMRSLVSEQLCVMEDILSDLSCRIGRIRSVDKALSERVRDRFSRLGFLGARACVYLDEAGFRHAEVFLSSEPAEEPVRMAIALSDICDCLFDIPSVSVSDRLTRLEFCELPVYETETGSFSAASSAEGCSGDTFGFVKSSCESYAVLSDGMGTGKRARLDSMFAVSLATKLLTAGVSMRSAHRMINSMLRVKGWDESFATLDILRLDLCAGTAELLKSGAAPTYLCRDGAFRSFGGEALPAGMLESCTPDIFTFKLFDGDTVIMTSDGVSEETVREALASCSDTDAETAAQKLGELALEKSEGTRRDDISVIVYKVSLKEREGDI